MKHYISCGGQLRLEVANMTMYLCDEIVASGGQAFPVQNMAIWEPEFIDSGIAMIDRLFGLSDKLTLAYVPHDFTAESWDSRLFFGYFLKPKKQIQRDYPVMVREDFFLRHGLTPF